MDNLMTSCSSLIDALSAEHAELLPQLERLMNVATANAPLLHTAVDEIAGRIGAALDEHIAQEDTVLFPAYAEAAGDSELVGQFGAEHREIMSLRDELLAVRSHGGDGAGLGGIALRLADLLISHMTREDMMLFPTMREVLD